MASFDPHGQPCLVGRDFDSPLSLYSCIGYVICENTDLVSEPGIHISKY